MVADLKRLVVFFVLLLVLTTPGLVRLSAAKAFGLSKGPRIRKLMIKFYNDTTVLYQDLKAGEVDLINQDLTSAQVADAEADPDLVLTTYRDSIIYQFAINLRETDPVYLGWRSPTSYIEFRRALAYLVNRDALVSQLVSGLGERIDAPVSTVMRRYVNPAVWRPNYPYEYDPSKAAAVLDVAGFVDGNGDGIRQYPPGHKRFGRNLEPLYFWTRRDDANMRMAAEMLRGEMEQIGIPFMLGFLPRLYEDPLIWGDWHLYTTALSGSPVLLYHFYHSRFPETMNFISFRNQTFDYWVEKLWNAPNFETVMESVVKCQEILVDQAASIWLWNKLGVDVYRKGWLGLINGNEFGVDNYWTFLNAFNEKESVMQLEYGLYIVYEPSLNVITARFWEWHALAIMYDSLLEGNPYDRSIMAYKPNLAKYWEIGTWLNPDNPQFPNSTKLIFYLRDDVAWHDGVSFTAYDVNFTIWYVRNFSGIAWNYDSVEDVHHVRVPDPYTIEVYMNITGVWALGWIGGLLILPMHVFGPTVPYDLAVPDPTGYYAGEKAGLSIAEALVGTGLFKHEAHDPASYLLLTANTDYFTTALLGDVNLDGTVDIYDLVAAAAAYDTTGTTSLNRKWNPAVDVAPPSGTINIYDLVTIVYNYGKTWQNG